RLAATARADQRDEFAVADAERDAAQRFDVARRGAVGQSDSLHVERRRHTHWAGAAFAAASARPSMSALLTSGIRLPLKKSAYLVSSGLRANSGPAKAISLFQSDSFISPHSLPSPGCLKIDSV